MTQFPQLTGFKSGPGIVRIIGHRGARGMMPENTIEGFEFTLKIGVDVLEFDVLLTQDLEPVVTHNLRLSPAGTRDPDGNWLIGDAPEIADLTLDQIRDFDVGGVNGRTVYGRLFPDQAFLRDVRIPTLSELFELVRRVRGRGPYLLLEMKSAIGANRADIVEKVVTEIRNADLADRTILHSFDWQILEECYLVAPEMPRSFLSQLPENDIDPGEDSSADVAPDFATLGKSIPQAVADAGGQMWCPHHRDVAPADVDEAHQLGLIVSSWTVNETEDINRIIDAGVDGIVTDFPGRAQHILLERGLSWCEDLQPDWAAE